MLEIQHLLNDFILQQETADPEAVLNLKISPMHQ